MDDLPQTLPAVCARALCGADRDIFAERDADGRWRKTRSHAVAERVEAIASGLRAAGITSGDRVAIMSPNRVDWIVTNLAIVRAGGVTVPLYATQAHDQVRHILDDSGARLLFVDSAQTRAALDAEHLVLPRTITFDGTGDGDDLAALEIAGRRAAMRAPAALETIAERIAPDDLAMLIYTSG
ncbi:MAG: long-chain fatty acid--CoA ligase, partial [Candidatus Eremiobacteraeota bacterium]|nr:long-chain fatty acid--CoA ligase [Candidatus Eremiobacteraeota bacterium]